MNRDLHRASPSKARGSMSAELAVLLCFVLIPLLIGIIDFGQVLYTKSVVTRAAREGVLAASRNQDIDAVVKTYMQNAGYDAAFVQVETSGTRTAGDPVTVSVGYNAAGLVIIPWEKVSPNITQVEASATAQQG